MHFLKKIQLINRRNFFYVVNQLLFKITKIKIFKLLGIIHNPNFNLLPNHYLYFENIINIIFKQNYFPDFKNKKILEIGGGSFWGLMPFFCKKKSLSYVNIDPICDNKIINSKYFNKKFLKNISKYIDVENINKFNKKNYDLIIEHFISNIKYDFVISISCLEHIDNIDNFFSYIKSFTNQKTIHIHIINFSNHLSKKRPFKYIYSNEKEIVLNQINAKINLLRISDYSKILKSKNFDFEFFVIDSSSIKKEKIDAYWRTKYTIDELQTRVAVLVIKNSNDK